VLPDYYRTQITFVFIYGICGFGLMLLAGFTGQISMGHAAFLAIGAYAETLLQAEGLPFVISAPLSMVLAGIAGVVIGLPALRLTGIYLAIATLAFGFCVEEILARWESMTGGNSGMVVPSLKLLTDKLSDEVSFYYLCMVCVVLVCLGCRNLLRSPTGRAFHRHPRPGGLGAEHGREPCALQDAELCAVRGDHRACRSALRAPDQVHQPRAVHADRVGSSS
jgi:branched-chain amino acid transport system permease protein